MSTLDVVRKIIAKITRCDPQSISLEMALRNIKADSLDWVQIIVGVEGAFDIEVDIDRMQQLVTVKDFVTYVDSCVK